MTSSKVIFLVLATMMVVFSILSVTERRILRAAIFLLFVLVATAALFYMMHYEFLAGVQLILYAGGIVVLIIFSILLTSQINSKLDRPKRTQAIAAVFTALGGTLLSTMTVMKYVFKPANVAPVDVNMRTIGLQLMGTGESGYALPFEVISMLLLAALVGTIFVAKKSSL